MKRKRSQKKILKDKAWKLFSEYIRRRDANDDGDVECITCHAIKPWKSMQAGHFIDGRTNSILFEEDGCHAQCYSCNMFKAGNKVEYFRYMQKRYGDVRIDELRVLRSQTLKFTESDLEEKIEYLKAKIAEMNSAK